MEIIDRGHGALFPDPDPDEARAFFRKKKMGFAGHTAKELRVLREEADPYRYVIGR